MSLFSLFSPHLLRMRPPHINDDLNFLKRRQHVGERWVDRGYATKPFCSPRRYCTTENECCEDIKSCQFFGKKWKVQIRLHLLRMFEKSLDIRNVFSYNMKRTKMHGHKINQNGLSENRTSGYINSHEFADVTETNVGAPGYCINNRTLFLSLLFRSCANKHMCK